MEDKLEAELQYYNLQWSRRYVMYFAGLYKFSRSTLDMAHTALVKEHKN